MKKQLQRVYNITDPELILICEDVLDSIARDIVEFADRGFTPAKKLAFETAISGFDTLPSDNYLEGLKEIATQTKDKERVLCETKVRTVLTAIENVWGADSIEYHHFIEDKPLSKLTDTELLFYLEIFADETESNLTELADEGINATTVTQLRALRANFNAALKAQRQATKQRTTGYYQRMAKGNALYQLLVSYCNTGKEIWLNVDESKYNDYIIYSAPVHQH